LRFAPPQTRPTGLIVEDDQEYRDIGARIIEEINCVAIKYDSADRAVECSSYSDPDLLIVDMRFKSTPYVTGLDVISKMLNKHTTNPIIVAWTDSRIDFEPIAETRGIPIDMWIEKKLDFDSNVQDLRAVLSKLELIVDQHHQVRMQLAAVREHNFELIQRLDSKDRELEAVRNQPIDFNAMTKVGELNGEVLDLEGDWAHVRLLTDNGPIVQMFQRSRLEQVQAAFEGAAIRYAIYKYEATHVTDVAYAGPSAEAMLASIPTFNPSVLGSLGQPSEEHVA
jgi:FixJ family two-component response regulator